MLEKIGLPAKPSLRGNNWVADASHCQGCSSQFTFINRKHHCRRCGGLFCNSCSQQRMVLRGQGDSPVRICEPCKKLEEAARFEMRHRSKNRAGGGSSKQMAKYEDEVLNLIIGADVKESFSPGLMSNMDTVSSIQRASSSASCSNIQETGAHDKEGEIHRSQSVDEQNNAQSEIGSASPEELRQQALEEKKKYKILKGEAKSDEALRAFKRGKELERQAEALEISIRRNRKRILTSGNLSEIQNDDGAKESGKKNKLLPQVGKEKDDFAAELRELGWSDMDLHNEGKKPASISLEGELFSLLGEVSQRTNKDMGTRGIDKTQVVAHKKRALTLKREGKLAEAKEELKKAKVLEKQLEEQELLAGAEDSDDELSAIISSMDEDKHDDLSIQYEQKHDFDFDHLVGTVDDLGDDGNFDVTDDDMVDPEIAASLKSFGWSEDFSHPENIVPQSAPVDRKTLSTEIQSLKREALNQKRAGNVAEAMAQLKKAKLLEKDLESFNSETADIPSKSVKVADVNVDATKDMNLKFAPKSRIMIQKELLALKKKALALRREGNLDEAEEELKKGKVLEHQLEEMDSASKMKSAQVTVGSKDMDYTYEQPDTSANLLVGEKLDVTDQEMHDPKYLSLLRNLGWNDEDNKHADSSSKPSKQEDNRSGQVTEASETRAAPKVPAVASRRSKAEIQRELLGLKREALSLRRLGKADEAEEVLETAKALEAQMAEMEAPKNFYANSNRPMDKISDPVLESVVDERDEEDVTEKDMHDPALLSVLKNLGWKDEELEPVTMQENKVKQVAVNPVHSAGPFFAPKSKGEIQRELLGLKRKALALRRKGETEEAEELLKMAKILEAQMEELEAPKKELMLDASRDEKSGSSESLMNHEKHGNLNNEVEVNKGSAMGTSGLNDTNVKSSMGSGQKESHIAISPFRNSDTFIPSTSQFVEDNHSLLGEVNPSGEMGVSDEVGTVEGARFAPPPGQYANMMDLLTGDDWTSYQIPAEKLEDRRNFGCEISCLAKPRLQLGSLASPHEDVQIKDGHTTEKREAVHVDEKPNNYEANSVQGFTSQNNQDSLRQEVLGHKRKAVAFKREGKLIEAREELRRAKLLERRLEEDNLQQKNGQNDVLISTSDIPSIGQKESSASNLAPKPLSGRDRFKLQQESLSHKRQALKLRREGRLQEAEAEFELAKNLEAQLDELASASGPEPVDDVVVEDLLDPLLFSALKAIGLDDANIVSKGPEKPENLKPEPVKSEISSQERSQLVERIKAEKIKAVNLKRSGKQAEALDALRRAKQYEKKLNSLAFN